MSKIDSVISYLNKRSCEKENEIASLLLSVLSGESVALIGRDAADDDSLITMMSECLEGSEVGRYMISSSTSPEEISGMGSKIGFTALSGIFNATSPVMNAVNGMMRFADKNFNIICGTSKNVPNEDDEHFAMYSAMLFRCNTRPISDGASFLKSVTSSGKSMTPDKISKKDIEYIRTAAAEMNVDDAVLAAMLSIREALDGDGKFVSDVRWKKSVDVMRIAAAASGRKSVDISLIPILQHILWDRPEQKKGIRNTIFEMCTPKSTDISDLLARSKELLRQVIESKGAIDENAGFPRVVHCYDCDESFVNLKRLKGHSQTHPRHAYADPNETEGRTYTYKRYSYSDLVTLLTSKYRWDIFKESDPAVRDGFVKEAAELMRRKTAFSESFEKDRSELTKNIENNIWLSSADKEDITSAFDRRSDTLNEIGGLISDIEIMIE